MPASLGRKLCLFAFGLIALGIQPAMAQYKDETAMQIKEDNTYKLSVSDIVIPTVVVGASAVVFQNEWLTNQRNNIQNSLSALGAHKIGVDDYSQFAPLVAAYGLDLCGVKGKHDLGQKTILLAMSSAATLAVVKGMKFCFNEQRPDSQALNSFPSGHTATAFMAAEYLRKEYKDVSPWIGVAGYAVAATTGYLRIYNNRHYINDVVAGAFLGVASVKVAYWLYPKIFNGSKNSKAIVAGNPYFSSESWGVNLCMVF